MSPATRRRKRNRIGRGLTFEKVWATIERNAEEAEKRHAEWEAKWQKEAEQRQKEAAEREAQQQKEAEQRQREDERRKKENEERVKIADREMQEIRNMNKETARVVKALGKQMGGLHRSFGEMAEHLVAPGIVDKFNEMGFHIMRAATHGMEILDEKKKVLTEVDLYMENGDYIFAIEVKARLGEKDIEKHRKQLEILREDANKRGDRRKILGGIAVAILEKGDKEAILDAGFYLLVQSGDTMKIDLPEGFVPREW